MILYYANTETIEVEQVEGDQYPGIDNHGRTCYTNTHFTTEESARCSLLDEAEARVESAARELNRARTKVLHCEKVCGNSAVVYEKAKQLFIS